MSDYLTNLIVRGQDHHTIRPRLPALFEPGALQVQSPSLVMAPSHRSDGEIARPDREGDGAPVPQQPPGHMPTVEPSTAVRNTRTPPRATAPQPAVVPAMRAEQVTAVGKSQGNSRTPANAALHSSSDRPHGPHIEPPASTITIRPPTGKPPVPASDARRQTTAPPTPAVRITIGRIDVRAVFPPQQPARRPEPTKPKLSLDAYLKQRNGERP